MAVALVVVGALYGFNNVSLMTDETFARRVDDSIDRAMQWVGEHKWDIASSRNVAMYMLLQECQELHDEPLLAELVKRSLRSHIAPACWRRVLDRAHPVDPAELNRTIQAERIDNRWMLYAIAPEHAELATEDLVGLYDTRRWKGRQLTHQLMALIRLRENMGGAAEAEVTAEQLSRRLSSELARDLAVVDLYIQKVAVVLDAGHEQMVRRRWVERVIENQRDDGGWNDRWCRVFTSFRRPAIDLRDPPSNQHATIQALWLLYLVKYRYPDRFGLAPGKAFRPPSTALRMGPSSPSSRESTSSKSTCSAKPSPCEAPTVHPSRRSAVLASPAAWCNSPAVNRRTHASKASRLPRATPRSGEASTSGEEPARRSPSV